MTGSFAPPGPGWRELADDETADMVWTEGRTGKRYIRENQTSQIRKKPANGQAPPEPQPDALNVEMRITSFPDVHGLKRTTVWMGLASFAENAITKATAASKHQLPLLKLAAFGERRSKKGSLRHDGNVLEVSGVELDYDGEVLPIDDAATILHAAKLPVILYSSPSHRPDAPRFRVLAPFSKPLPPEQREKMVGRIAGLFPVDMAGESWTLSQAFFYGSIAGQPPVIKIAVDGDNYVPVDLRDDLDATTKPKPNGANRAGHAGGPSEGDDWFDPGPEPADEDDLRARIASGGRQTHQAMVSLAGLLARRGLAKREVYNELRTELLKRPESARDAGWHKHLNDAARIADWTEEKEREKAAGWGDADEPPPIDLSILRLNRRSPPPFPLAVLGAEWMGWVKAEAEAAACPVDYVAAPLLATGSALIGNARWPQAWHGWDEPPHLWLADVGDSGDGKTPGAASLFRQIVPALERRMTGDYPDRLAEWEAASAIAEAKEAEFKAQVKAALKAGEAPPPRPDDLDPGPRPEEPRLKLGDVTIEKVAQVLATAAPKGVLMERDELAGWLLGMNQYNDGARPFWIESWNGGPYRVDRVKFVEPYRIAHLAVAWFGGVQPERLVKLMTAPDDGLLARYCWCWPDPIAFDRSRAPRDIEFAINALDKLRLLEMHRNADGTLAPVLVPLVSDAQTRLVAFGKAMQQRREFATGLLRSTIGKARGIALRVSAVLEFLWWCGRDSYDPPPTVISDAALEAATHWVDRYAIPMAERVYGDAALSDADRNISTLARWIVRDRPDEVHVRTMLRQVRLPLLADIKALRATCLALIEAGWLLPPRPTSPWGGRPREAYRVNPRLWEALT